MTRYQSTKPSSRISVKKGVPIKQFRPGPARLLDRQLVAGEHQALVGIGLSGSQVDGMADSPLSRARIAPWPGCKLAFFLKINTFGWS